MAKHLQGLKKNFGSFKGSVGLRNVVLRPFSAFLEPKYLYQNDLYDYIISSSKVLEVFLIIFGHYVLNGFQKVQKSIPKSIFQNLSI